jgi:hypothetical protein
MLRQAWQAHRDLLDGLSVLDPGRNWPALKSALKAYVHALGGNFESFQVIALGTHGIRITGLAGAADDHLIVDVAPEIRSLAVAHGLLIGQFDEWRDYLAKAQDDPPPPAVLAANAVLRSTGDHPEVIALDIAEPAKEIAEATEPDNLLPEGDARDQAARAMGREAINSTANIISGLVKPIGRYIGDAGNAMRSGSIEEFKAAGKWATRIIGLLSMTEVSVLVGLLPQQFSWLPHAISLIRSVFGL